MITMQLFGKKLKISSIYFYFRHNFVSICVSHALKTNQIIVIHYLSPKRYKLSHQSSKYVSNWFFCIDWFNSTQDVRIDLDDVSLYSFNNRLVCTKIITIHHAKVKCWLEMSNLSLLLSKCLRNEANVSNVVIDYVSR